MSRYIMPMGGGLLLAIASLLAVPSTSRAAEGQIKTFSTGIGEIERGPHSGYSTVLFFSEKGTGSMVADVKVAIFERGPQGKRKVLDTSSSDPLLFANLPAGKYYVEAEFRGHKEGSAFVVDGKCQKVVGLSWPMGKAAGTERMARSGHEHRAGSQFVQPCTVSQNTSG